MQKVVFIYVHGFGERRFPPAFEKKMKVFLKPLAEQASVVTYRWDSQELNVIKVMKQWQAANRNAVAEGKTFAADVIEKYEGEKVSYYLVGYSLGCKVIMESLKHVDKPLRNLGGIYFLGAALPKDFRVKSEMLPPQMKIVNYYSGDFDSALKISFSTAEKIKAGGEVGFLNDKIFQNYRTVSTHVHKGGPLQRDYSILAEPIGFLALHREKILIEGEGANFNLESQVWSGSLHWNDLCQFDREDGKLLIQLNANTGHYRAVSISEDGKRTRKAWGSDLHSLLMELGLFDDFVQKVPRTTE
jgi:hypothetical protein